MEHPPQANRPPDRFLPCYLANLAALYRVDPGLAAEVDAVPFCALPPLEPARDGHVTVCLTADDGKPLYAHSRYRPVEEAQTLVRTQTRRADETSASATVDDSEGLDNECFLIAGLGLGYHVAEIEKRYPRPILIVAEDDRALLKAALCVTDLSKPLGDRRLAVLTSADKSHVHERLRPAMAPMLLGLHFITLPHARRFHAVFQNRISGLLRDFVSYARLQMVSVVRNARITCQNSAFNLAAYLKQPGIEVLAGRGRGYPAILVAAGPSLARNIDQLGELRERAVLIAVQTVLKTLLALGIRPHFVTSLDYHEVSAQFFQGVPDFGATILVAEPKVTWHVLDAFPGRTHVLRSAFIEDLLRAAAPPRAGLRSGSTVAHLSFYLAEHLGCNPILLVGQDLSFSDGLYYPPGMQIERVWRPELGRFQTVEMKQWERIARHRGGLRKVKDIHGRDTYTDDQLFTYAEQFQSDFLQTSSRIIHATEGGMRLEGTEVMTLRQAAEQFCTRPLPPDLFAAQSQPLPANALAPVCAELEQRLAELRTVQQIATDTRETLRQMADLVERPGEFNRLVVRVDELRARMQRNDRTYNLVSQVSQLAELRRLHADRGIHDDRPETPPMARRRLKRDQEYVDALVDGCAFMLEILPEAMRRVRERMP